MDKISTDNPYQDPEETLIERIAKIVHPLAFVPDEHQPCTDLASLYRAKARERARTILDMLEGYFGEV